MFEYNDLDYLSDKLKVDINKGLSSKEALKRQSVMGKNILDNKRKESVIKVILLQLKDPMIYILLVSILISLFLKEYSDSIVIGVVVIVNALIGGIQQIKTEKALEKLKQMSEHTCYVYRDGEKVEISSANLVRGDVLVLETGKSVGADCRVIEASNLKVDESSLTGESNFIKKENIVLNKSVKNIGDKKNMCFMSSLVVSGYGKGVVTNIGMNTEIGHIAKVLKEEKKDLTPLQLKLNKLGKLLGVLTIIICLMLFVIGLASGRNLIEMILTSLSLLVAAIPEGLPAVVTIVLAIGVSRMIRVNALIRKLPSVETLGSVNVVCSDKTGTLTENKLTVSNVYENNKYIDKGNRCSDRLVRVMSLCNNAQKVENYE